MNCIDCGKGYDCACPKACPLCGGATRERYICGGDLLWVCRAADCGEGGVVFDAVMRALQPYQGDREENMYILIMKDNQVGYECGDTCGVTMVPISATTHEEAIQKGRDFVKGPDWPDHMDYRDLKYAQVVHVVGDVGYTQILESFAALSGGSWKYGDEKP